MRRLPPLLLAPGLALIASLASAQPRPDEAPERLYVTRDAEATACPDVGMLGQSINAIAAREVVVPAADASEATLLVTFGVGPGPGTYRANLLARGAKAGERAFDDEGAPSCEALGEAVAVATALLFDGDREGEPLPGPPAPPAPLAPPPSPPVAPASVGNLVVDVPPDGAATTAPEDFTLGAPTVWAIDALLSFSTVLVERGSPEVGLWARRRLGVFSVAAGARWNTPVTERFAAGTVDVWGLRGAAEACLDVEARASSATLSPCGTFSAGAAFGSGSDYDVNETAAAPQVDLGAALLLGLQVAGPARVVLRGGGMGALVRPRFQITDRGGADPGRIGEAYRAPAFAFDAGAGVRIGFP